MGAMDDNTDYRFREGLVSLWTVRYTEIPKISPMVYVHMGLYVCLGVHSHSIFHKAYKVVVDWEKNSLLAQGTILPWSAFNGSVKTNFGKTQLKSKAVKSEQP